MPENRFFAPVPFEKDQTLTLEGEEFHHLKVMRCQPNDTLELVNGQNQLAQGLLTHLSKHNATFRLNHVDTAPPPSRQIILAQALLRPKNLDLVIEKGTELGATAFHLFPAEHSEKETLTPNQLDRLHHLMVSALKQCGRLDLPSLHIVPSLSSWIPSTPLFFGDLEASSGLPSLHTSATFVIGPEKGFSLNEISALKALKAQGVRLTPHTLRAETAALCALALLCRV